jgi:CRP-like cAMP-binding protein
MKQDLISFVKRIIELPQAEENKLLELTRISFVKKGDYYIQAGQTPKKFGFLSEGLFRYLYIDTKGTEYTKNFIPENNFVLAYSAMILQQPSKMYIEALEDSTLYDIDYSHWLKLKEGHPCWNIFLVKLLEHAFMIKEKRERELLLLGAEQRYRIFQTEFPSLETRIKQHLIASYLGISPVSLSRLKRKTNLLT